MARIEQIVFILVIAVTVAIIVSGDPLPMYDVSSHLATTVVLDGLHRGDPFFTERYEILPIAVPYWLTTALHWPLTLVFGPWLAMRLLVATFAVALPLGWLVLARRTGAALPLATIVALATCGGYYWSGVTNFVFGQALLAPAFALFLGLGERPGRRLAGIAALLVAAYFAHVFVVAAILGAFATALVFTGLAPRVGLERDFSVRPAHWLATGLATVAFGAAVWFVFAHPGDGANSGRPLFDLSPLRLANLFEEPLSSPTLWRPLPALGLGFVVLAAWGIANRNAPARGVHFTTLAVAVAFAVLYWVGPTSLLEADGRIEEDIVPRFAPAVFLFGLAALRLPDRRGPRLLLLLTTLAFAGVKLADVSFLHQRQHEVWREYRAAILEALPEHAKILPILNEKGRNAPATTYFFQFLGNYVVPERGGYSPSLYAQRGQQFLRHLPPGGNGVGEHRDIYDRDVTETEWDFYDYLVVQTNREAPDIPGLAERTDFVTAAAGFRLYRIRHDEPRGAAAGAGAETGADLNPR